MRKTALLKKSILLLISCFIFINLTSISSFADTKKGKKIFKSKSGNCKKCHKLNEETKVGPGLKGMFDRYSEDWLRKWLKDPQGTWKENDPETQKMKKRLGKENKKETLMKLPKGGLTDEQVNDLFDFLKEAIK